MDTSSSPPTLRGAVAIAGLMAVGAALLAIAHTGVTVPVLSRFGPQGGAVLPAVVAFAIGTAVFAAIAVGLHRRTRWGWALGLVVAVLSILSGIGQFRGAASAVGIALAVVLAGLLLHPATRRATSTDTAT